MIKLIMILLLSSQVKYYSHTDLVVKSNPVCQNVPYFNYNVELGISCVPSDVIFTGGFDQ